MEQDKIRDLANKLENKEGCPLMEALKDMDFSAQIKALRSIEDTSINVIGNRSNLKFDRNAEQLPVPGLIITKDNSQIFKTAIGLHSGRVYMECMDNTRKSYEKE